MGKLKGTETLKNLMRSFVGECQARMRYTYFASIAKKEGFMQISNYFTETANNEKEHGEMFYKYIASYEYEMGQAVMVPVQGDFPVALGDTRSNLIHAADGENEEWRVLYRNFGDVAQKEGFPEIAKTFYEIAEAEKAHEARFLKLADNIDKDRVFKRPMVVKWICGNCGYIHEDKQAPEECPACKHAKAYFELFVENY